MEENRASTIALFRIRQLHDRAAYKPQAVAAQQLLGRRPAKGMSTIAPFTLDDRRGGCC